MISPTQRPLRGNTQYLQKTDIHALGGIRTHNPSKRAAADPRLRPRGLWDRHWLQFTTTKYKLHGKQSIRERNSSVTTPNVLRLLWNPTVVAYRSLHMRSVSLCSNHASIRSYLIWSTANVFKNHRHISHKLTNKGRASWAHKQHAGMSVCRVHYLKLISGMAPKPEARDIWISISHPVQIYVWAIIAWDRQRCPFSVQMCQVTHVYG